VSIIDTEPVVNTTMVQMNVDLAREQQREAGLNALARMSEGEFVERLNSLRVGLDRFDLMMAEVLTAGNHAGADLMFIDGVDKPIMTQSAAEKICFVTRLVPSFVVERVNGGELLPPIHYIVRCNLHLGNHDGPVVAQGIGSANSFEKKYRWRMAEKKCPECGVVGSVLRSKHADDRGPFLGQTPFFCWAKKGGCGKKFAQNDERITQQPLGQVENPDPYDLDNTLLKMAKKRAFVDAAKTATASSSRVTVDLEEGTAATDEAKKLRDAIMLRAAQAGFKTRGELWVVVKQATGSPVSNIQEFEVLNANSLAKVLAAMPAPLQQADAEASLPDVSLEPDDDAVDVDTFDLGRHN